MVRHKSRLLVYPLALLSLTLLVTLRADTAAINDVSGPPLSDVGMLSRFAREAGLPGAGAAAPSPGEQHLPSPQAGVPAGPSVTPEIRVNQDLSFAPQNETTIAVNPASPNMIVAGANDYRLGAPIGAAFYTSFDGGSSWTDGFPPFPLLAGARGHDDAATGATAAGAAAQANGGSDPDAPTGKSTQLTEPPFGTGDPVVAFGQARPGSADLPPGASVAYYAYLGVSSSFCEHGIFVSRSTNGLTWTRPAVPPLLPPRGLYTPVYWDHEKDCSVFNDKPWMTVDRSGGLHNGRVYVVWARFLRDGGGFRQSTIEMSYSDDNAETWSEPSDVSGTSEELCPAQVTGKAGRCDESQFATAVVAPNGTLVVAFINQQAHGSEDGLRNQYLITRVNPDTFALAGPYRAASMIDGQFDFPVNALGQATLCNSNFRLNTAGNLAIDPSDATGQTLYIVFADNRNGSSFPDRPTVSQDPPDSFLCPAGTSTDTDIFLVRSTDGGATWSQPDRVNQDGQLNGRDQWFPFAAVGPNGTISVIFEDRRDDFFNRLANVYLARSADGGQSWTERRLTSVPSNLNWAFEHGFFIGDYNAVAIAPNGTVYPFWTDSRDGNTNIRQSDVYMAVVPP